MPGPPRSKGCGGSSHRSKPMILIPLQYSLQQRYSIPVRSLGISGEGRSCGLGRPVHIRGGAECDLGEWLLCRRIDDIKGAMGERIDPCTVDVELKTIIGSHAFSPIDCVCVASGCTIFPQR